MQRRQETKKVRDELKREKFIELVNLKADYQQLKPQEFKQNKADLFRRYKEKEAKALSEIEEKYPTKKELETKHGSAVIER